MGTVWQTPEDQLKVEDGREEVEIGEGSVLASYKKILGGCNFFFFFLGYAVVVGLLVVVVVVKYHGTE